MRMPLSVAGSYRQIRLACAGCVVMRTRLSGTPKLLMLGASWAMSRKVPEPCGYSSMTKNVGAPPDASVSGGNPRLDMKNAPIPVPAAIQPNATFGKPSGGISQSTKGSAEGGVSGKKSNSVDHRNELANIAGSHAAPL